MSWFSIENVKKVSSAPCDFPLSTSNLSKRCHLDEMISQIP